MRSLTLTSLINSGKEGRKEGREEVRNGRKGCQGRTEGSMEEVKDERWKEGMPGKEGRKDGSQG